MTDKNPMILTPVVSEKQHLPDPISEENDLKNFKKEPFLKND
jgi:hypothetical protein